MSPEQLSFMIGSIYGSTLTLLLFHSGKRSRNRRDPFLDCRERRGSNPPSPNTKPQPPSGPPPRDQDPGWRRSFNHDNTNKKPTSDSRPRLFCRRPPEVIQ